MCKCIAEINEKLAAHNTKIELPMLGLQQPFVSTTKIDTKKRGKPVMMFASFCPFCGQRYREQKAFNFLKTKL